MKDVPDALNKIVDVVLAYKPKPKTKAAKKRKRLKAAKERASDYLVRVPDSENGEGLHQGLDK